MNRNGEVGFGQRIQLDWLDRTANLFIAGLTRDEIEESLQAFQQDRLSIGSDAKRGNRALTISILLKVWVEVPHGLESLRDEGLDLLKRLPAKDHLVVHWGKDKLLQSGYRSRQLIQDYEKSWLAPGIVT